MLISLFEGRFRVRSSFLGCESSMFFMFVNVYILNGFVGIFFIVLVLFFGLRRGKYLLFGFLERVC